jgi:hypothetical protein
MQSEFRWCPECQDEQVFDAPPCEDGHGFDCLDLACGMCGFALVLGHVQVDEPVLVGAQAA